jgi:aminobenzoyl-glutamate utilization protein B
MDLRRSATFVLAAAVWAVPLAAAPAKGKAALQNTKAEAIASIERRRSELVSLADQVWGFAETALRETRSAKVLADYAEQQGFKVGRGVAGMPTAFVASYGEGRPIIGIMGEYDALPGLSQKAVPSREILTEGAPGHGCGHNLFGAASLGAAVAIKEAIAAGQLAGTIRFYGTPAEESVGGKVYMVRAGLFKDVDVALAWHPDTENRPDTQGGQAIVDMVVEFKGKTSHAAFDPWNGRSALDGLELFTHAINLMREHVKPTVRLHYVVANGGNVPNVIPEYAKLWLWVRDVERAGLEDVLARVRKAAEGAALAAGVESTITVQAGDYEMLINQAGAKLLHANLLALGPIAYTAEEDKFARTLQASAGVEAKGMNTGVRSLEGQENQGGSTDVGDVSWNVATLHVSIATAPAGVPWHAWPVVAAGGMSIGHKGMVHAAKTLATTMADLFDDAAAREGVVSEFREKTKDFTYKAYIPDSPPPLPTN